jgi:hypothetical protein
MFYLFFIKYLQLFKAIFFQQVFTVENWRYGLLQPSGNEAVPKTGKSCAAAV